jgi:glycosyltransferase involved in cell wall biosynthesis
VEFLGVVSKEQIRDVLQSSDVHIYFTKPRGISWSLLEAFACGCVVITSDVDGLREVTGSPDAANRSNSPDRWCILTNHDDYEGTKKKILDVLDNRDDSRIQAIRSNARKFVMDKYDSRVNGDNWKLLINALI